MATKHKCISVPDSFDSLLRRISYREFDIDDTVKECYRNSYHSEPEFDTKFFNLPDNDSAIILRACLLYEYALQKYFSNDRISDLFDLP